MKDYQSLLFPYAYNILGSAEDAKDAIQDVLLNYTEKDITPENEKNYLIRGVINKSINLKKRDSRKHNIDEWLPEPVATDTSDLGYEMRQLVSYSMMFLLERLNPKERAVFILKEAFAYSHEEIAEVLSLSVTNSRKLLSRAHQRISSSPKAAIPQSGGEHLQQVEHFSEAIERKDLDALHDLLSDDIVLYADGGEKVKVVKKILPWNKGSRPAFAAGKREISTQACWPGCICQPSTGNRLYLQRVKLNHARFWILIAREK